VSEAILHGLGELGDLRLGSLAVGERGLQVREGGGQVAQSLRHRLGVLSLELLNGCLELVVGVIRI